MNCSKCGISCFKQPLHRNNPKGEVPADMRCLDCLDKNIKVDPIVKDICEIIINDNDSV